MEILDLSITRHKKSKMIKYLNVLIQAKFLKIILRKNNQSRNNNYQNVIEKI